MRALEFLLNGKRVCVAAPGGDGLVISSIVLTGADGTADDDVLFRIGGVRDEQHLEWLYRSIALGDVVEIRVIDSPHSDPPASVEPISDAQRERLRAASDTDDT